jgi:uncharacterized protein YndB with AHSA1/START domain
MESEDRRTIEVSARVAAPVEDVFRAFTDADAIAAWWGPEGFTVSEARAVARPGGAVWIGMVDPDGTVQPIEGMYREVEPPSHVSFSLSAMQPDGTSILDAFVTVDLAAGGVGTEIHVTAEGEALDPAARPMLAGMYDGWVSSLRSLERFLEEAENPSLKMRHDTL